MTIKQRSEAIRLAIQELDDEALPAMIRLMYETGNPDDATDKAFMQELLFETISRDKRSEEAERQTAQEEATA